MTAILGARDPSVALLNMVNCGVLKSLNRITDAGWCRYVNGQRQCLVAATNGCWHPGFEADAGAGLSVGWPENGTPSGTPTYSRSANGDGTYSQRIRYTGMAGDSSGLHSVMPLSTKSGVGSFSPSQVVPCSVVASGALVGCNARMVVYFYNSSGGYISNSTGPEIVLTSTPTRSAVYAPTAPALTSQIAIGLQVYNIGTGDTVDVTWAYPMVGAYAPYFDGATQGCSWAGTAYASVSNRPGTSLIYPYGTYVAAAQGTILVRVTPTWAGGDGLAHTVLTIRDTNDANDVLVLSKNASNKWQLAIGGTVPTNIQSAAQTFISGSTHLLVARWSSADQTLDLNVDGTTVTQVANTSTITVGKLIVGADANLGPISISPTRKSDNWTAAVAASPAQAAIPLSVARDMTNAPALTLPMQVDNRAFIRVSGTGTAPPDYVGKLALRFDDGPMSDYTVVYPALVAAGLTAGFAVPQSYIGGGGYPTLANWLTVQASGNEIMCHSRTHGADPANFAAFQDETAGAALDMRSAGLNVTSFVEPGSWVIPGTYLLNSESYWGGAADTLLRANFSTYMAYIDDAKHELPMNANARWGGTDFAGGEHNLAWLKQWTTTIAEHPYGMVFDFHSASFDQGGFTTTADFLAYITWLAGMVAAGRIQVVNPTALLTA